MSELAYMLPASLTNDYRRYLLAPVRGVCFDALLTIQNGRPGPRGGTSKMSIESYMVQEDLPDPQQPAFSDRVFLIAKLSGPADCVDDIPDDPPECVYEVRVPQAGGPIGCCTCPGGRMVGNCKHRDTFEHLCHVVGIGPDFKPRNATANVLRCDCMGNDPQCFLCSGTGFVEIEPLGREEYSDAY
jgi:hypothetical protein